MGRQESEIEYPFLHSKGLVLGELATNFGMMVLKEEMLKLRNGFHIGRYVGLKTPTHLLYMYV